MTTPKIAKKGPYKIHLEGGKKYFWCACGESKNQPFCDGSHQGTEFSPMPFTVDKEADVFLCGCKHSTNKPYCDGTHTKL